MQKNKLKSLIHFHFIVFIFGFTAILGSLISIESLALVWYRRLIAFIFLILIAVIFKINIKVSNKLLIKLLFCGVLISLHWITFFKAIKVSNVSITLSVLSLGAFLTSFLEPLFYKRKIIPYEVFLGVFVVFGTSLIFKSQYYYIEGIFYALISVFLSVIFGLINGKLIKQTSPLVISIYELLGGVILTTLILIFIGDFNFDFFNLFIMTEQQDQINIELDEQTAEGIYSNLAIINHSSSEFVLDFVSIMPGIPKAKVKSRIVLTPQHAKRLLKAIGENIHRFEAIISGNRTRISEEEITVDQVAAKLMANLYLELEDHGFEGHETSIFLIRILFLLFGDDTGMWAKNTFLKLVMGTKEDGSDVGSKLDTLFEVLNTPEDKRPKALGEEFKPFPYVNGGIFAEKISVIDFNKKMRVALVDVANYDWTTINPTIFGSLFQLIKSKEDRRELGEHYTTEENINKIAIRFTHFLPISAGNSHYFFIHFSLR